MNRTTLNANAIKLLNMLHSGDNLVQVGNLAQAINKARWTTHKYLNLLEENKLIKRTIVGLSGGTANEAKRQLIIHKF